MIIKEVMTITTWKSDIINEILQRRGCWKSLGITSFIQRFLYNFKESKLARQAGPLIPNEKLFGKHYQAKTLYAQQFRDNIKKLKLHTGETHGRLPLTSQSISVKFVNKWEVGCTCWFEVPPLGTGLNNGRGQGKIMGFEVTSAL